jgi:hypothetical protein
MNKLDDKVGFNAVWEGSRQGGWVGGIALGLYLSLGLCAGMGEPRSLNLLPEPAAKAFAVAHASAVFSGGYLGTRSPFTGLEKLFGCQGHRTYTMARPWRSTL